MKKYYSMQYLRATAALFVVFHHARNPTPGFYDPLASFGLGRAGVDIFFVISGFIMYSASRTEAAGEFLRRRVIRVVPLYWIATLCMVALATGHHGGHAGISGQDVIQSLFFIPHYSPAHPDQIWPYLVPGWTLNYEMFFYAIFALGLLTRRLVPVLLASMGALLVLGLVFRSQNALWLTYTSPLLLEFLGGVAVAKWAERKPSLRWALLLPAGAQALGLSVFTDLPQVIAWGAPAAMMVMGAVAIEQNGKLPSWKLLGLLGDASYSIYLFQMIALGRIGFIVQKLPLKGPVQFVAITGVALLAASAVGVIAHYLLERPITRFLSRRSRPRVVLPVVSEAVASYE